MAALATWVANHPVFAITSISVTGEVTHNNEPTLRANVTPRLAGNFFTLDLAHTRQVFEAMPWVRSAVVRRVFPNRLQVRLQEHQAVAYWGAESESYLLNNHGEVFEANLGEVEQEMLPRLDGPTGQEPQVLAMYEVLQPLFAPMEMELEQLELSGRGGWTGTARHRCGHRTGSRQRRRGDRAHDPVSAHADAGHLALQPPPMRWSRPTCGMRMDTRLRGVSTVVTDSQKK